jgi:type I restriction enzyme R subunit
VHQLITEDIPSRVAADTAYRNAKQNSDKQNARIEHDQALARVMTAVLKDGGTTRSCSSSSATTRRFADG